MYTLRKMIFTTYTLCVLLNVILCRENLLMSHVIYRHGQRNPWVTFPNSINTNWTGGLGRLRPEGIIQMYNLGKSLREKYIDQERFINKDFNLDEIRVQSSSSERCLVSAQAFMSGMFPENKFNQSDKETQWQPIPIYSSSPNNDTLRINSIPCVKRNQLFEELVKSKFWTDYIEQNKEFLDSVYKHSGYGADIFNVWKVFDELHVAKLIGRNLPKWVTDEVYEKIEGTAKFFVTQKYGSKDERIQKVLIGPLLFSIAQHMIPFLSEREKHELPEYFSVRNQLGTNQTKLHIYFTHDILLYPLLSAFEVQLEKLIPFAASITIELREAVKNNATNLILKFVYSDNLKNNKTLTSSSNQSKEISLMDFLKGFEKKFVSDFGEICKIDQKNMTTVTVGTKFGSGWTKRQYFVYLIAASYGGLCTLALVALFIYGFHRSKNYELLL